MEFRKTINAATNKSEAFNRFTKWTAFGNNTTITENNRDHQNKIIKYNHLVSNLIILHNVDTMTKVINKMQDENFKVNDEIKSALSPYRTEHINRFGIYSINTSKKPSSIQFNF